MPAAAAPIAIVARGVRRQRDDRHLACAGNGANRGGGLKPIHDRHLQIHEHHVELLPRHDLDCLLSIGDEFDRMAAPAQRAFDNCLVGASIFNNQHAEPPLGGIGRQCR